MRLKPALGCAKDTKPSAAIASSNPKWRLANAAEAEGSSTLSEIADAVICIGRIFGRYSDSESTVDPGAIPR
jgi:hypothetical protein